MRILINILLVIVVFYSCNSQQKDVKNIVREWQGREIVVPQQIEYKILGRDTLCTDFWNRPYKILTYIDSVGCSSCQMGLPYWQSLIEIVEHQQLDVAIVFVIHSSNYPLLSTELKAFEFNYPVVYDYDNSFDKLNHFPPAPYRTFLLDKDNKVQLIGSPIDTPQVWELYKKMITQSQ
ncbi:MAG: hypothetical protein LBV47_07860 [Bacteroidales bacterium]|jgi:hypothetical protein|nr:hypothetical protein [Bacteroidales bacterium]